MAHVPSLDEELATARCKLKQATKELVEKDLEIEALKQEVASLRQGCSRKSVTEGYSTSLSIVELGCNINE